MESTSARERLFFFFILSSTSVGKVGSLLFLVALLVLSSTAFIRLEKGVSRSHNEETRHHPLTIFSLVFKAFHLSPRTLPTCPVQLLALSQATIDEKQDIPKAIPGFSLRTLSRCSLAKNMYADNERFGALGSTRER